MSLDQAPSDALEALVGSNSDASDTFAAWLSDLRAQPGRYPSLQTWMAYSLYRRWCVDRALAAVQPFTFAKLMGMRFRKVHARWGHKTSRFWAMDKATARDLRLAILATPPAPEEMEAFSFDRLRRVPRKDTR